MGGASESIAALTRRHPTARWVIWLAAVAAVTGAMYAVRPSLDKAHVALVFLILVLGASASGGRVLGMTVAGLGFLSFDFFFLPPYGTLTITNPLDWLVLVAFLVTSVVAAQLLYRATSTAELATQRAVEVDRLASLGAETLNAADATEALHAIAEVIRGSIEADECDIYLQSAEGTVLAARASGGRTGDGAAGRDARAAPVQPGGVVDWVLEHGTGAVELNDGTVRMASSPASPPPGDASARLAASLRELAGAEVRRGRRRAAPARQAVDAISANAADRPSVRAFSVPLQVHARTVGVLRVTSAPEVTLTPAQARLLTALAYYAALGAERARLTTTAQRAEAEWRVEQLRSALLTAVSHDLRTPLTTIKGIAAELLGGADRGRAAVIEAEADRLDALVGDLLDLSRIHAGALRAVPAVNTIDDLFGAALQRGEGRLRSHRVIVDVDDGELLAGIFDFTQTLRIVVNLLDNAAKYSPPGAPIDLGARRAGDRLMIEVLDRGPGVPEAERDRIFEPFYRPPGAPPDIGGHGLGLSIARGLAEAQRGTVRFAAREGGGSVFSLELPAADMRDLEREAHRESVSPGAP